MGMIHEEEELFTTDEAAKLLQVHPSTVRKLAKEGVLVRRRAYRHHLFVTADSVRAFEEARHLSLNDLSTRLLLLERKVDRFIVMKTVTQDDEMLSQISGVFEKNHPHSG